MPKSKVDLPELICTTRQEWRDWLAKNHKTSSGVWLVIYKKASSRPTLDYDAVVEEALCYGWIDSLVKKIDEESYCRKVTPRRSDSVWSSANRQRAEDLIRSRKMRAAGKKLIDVAKQNGQWENASVAAELAEADELNQLLNKHPNAAKLFRAMSPSCQRTYHFWIASAKRESTRLRRANEALTMILEDKSLGLK